MELLIGLVVGVLLVAIVIALGILYVRAVPQRRKPFRRGDGRSSIGPAPDTYGEPHSDHHGGHHGGLY
jgi:hypothetical protein